jgi:6-phosphogluconate dehydrogenase
MKALADIAVIGLAVMGENLILNIESKGFTVACFNRTVAKVDKFLQGRAYGKDIVGCHSLEDLVQSLSSPKKVMLMVRSGKPVDSFIDKLIPLLDQGDIIIDGGNSHYSDSLRRHKKITDHGLNYIGAGISGGEIGALNGPSIMPGGSEKSWETVSKIFQKISAKAPDGKDCCEWIGPSNSGHFVKMVHNGIEYGDMQLIAEAYHLMSQGLNMPANEIATVFDEWNQTELDSYLIEITADILRKTDEETQRPLIELILDVAGQKGTGKWTSQAGLELGVGIPQIAEAVFARSLSAIKNERIHASSKLCGPSANFIGDKDKFLFDLKNAVLAAKVCSYAQGFQLLKAASDEYNWQLKLNEIALIWRGGCIIRAKFLDKIGKAFKTQTDLKNLLLSPYFRDIISNAQHSWREIVKNAIDFGIPVPAISAALSYYDSYRCKSLPANLLQAQRDYFGAHTYERIDKPRGEFFHTNWTGEGGKTASTSYEQ